MSAAPLRHPRPIPQPSRTSPSRPSVGRAQPTPRRQPNGRPTPGQGRHLHAVQAPEQARSLVPFAWTCALIVIGALSAVLLLNTSMAKGAYERRDLKIEIANLHEQRATLVTQLELESSPHQLGESARALGMVPAGTFGFISLEDGIVIESGSK